MGNFGLVLLFLFIILGVYSFLKPFENLGKRIERLEYSPPHTGGINKIVNFSLSLTKTFFENLKKITKFEENIILKIRNATPKIVFKIETYAKDFTRTKAWYILENRDTDNWESKERYAEEDDPNLYTRPYIIWSIGFWEHMPKEKQNIFENGYLQLSYHEGNFMLYLIGGEFGSEDMIDHRRPLEKNILFKVKASDFKELEKYHLLYDENYRDGTAPWFYTPTIEHRKYGNSFRDAREIGIYWSLDWFDFSGEILPKLSYDKEHKISVAI